MAKNSNKIEFAIVNVELLVFSRKISRKIRKIMKISQNIIETYIHES